MKRKFSKSWKASKQPRKQRKYKFQAPLHIKRKMLSTNLAEDLRKKLGKRNIVIRKDDKVKIMRGKFYGKQGKVVRVFTKIGKVTIEGIQIKKQDGSKANIKLYTSNLQITELAERGKMEKAKTENKEVKNTAKSEIKSGEHKK